MFFGWDDVNRVHIAKHGVAPGEAEEVVRAARAPFPTTTGDEMKKRKQRTIDENDFEGLDRFARSITLDDMRPLSAKQRREWLEAKRGRPRKRPGTKFVPTMITVEPTLLKKVDAYAKKAGISRSRLFAESVRQRLRKAG